MNLSSNVEKYTSLGRFDLQTLRDMMKDETVNITQSSLSLKLLPECVFIDKTHYIYNARDCSIDINMEGLLSLKMKNKDNHEIIHNEPRQNVYLDTLYQLRKLYTNPAIRFIQVSFSVANTNNFAALVPILIKNKTDVHALMPWNGHAWETFRSNISLNKKDAYTGILFRPMQTEILQNKFPETLDTATLELTRLFEIFKGGNFMRDGQYILAPFCTNGGSWPENLFTYSSIGPVGTYLDIGQTQICMSDQVLPLILVENIIRNALNMLALNICCTNIPFLQDIVYQAICMSIYLLAPEKSYRPDITGEDINVRFSENSTNGVDEGDCEDWTQLMIQVINTLKCNLNYFLERIPEYSITLKSVFSPYIQTNAYMARGILHNKGENGDIELINHTFGVILHSIVDVKNDPVVSNHYRLSIIECTLPVFIFPDEMDIEWIQTYMKKIQYTNDIKTRFHCSSYKESSMKYTNITWVFEYMAFHVKKNTSTEKFEFKLGISPYTTFSDCIYVHTVEELTRFKEKRTDNMILLVLPVVFLEEINFFMEYAIQKNRLKDEKNTDFAFASGMKLYIHEMRTFANEHIVPLFNENSNFVQVRFSEFLKKPENIKLNNVEITSGFGIIAVVLAGLKQSINIYRVHVNIDSINSALASAYQEIFSYKQKEIKQINGQITTVLVDTILMYPTCNHLQNNSIQHSVLNFLSEINNFELVGDLKKQTDPFLKNLTVAIDDTNFSIVNLLQAVIDFEIFISMLISSRIYVQNCMLNQNVPANCRRVESTARVDTCTTQK